MVAGRLSVETQRSQLLGEEGLNIRVIGCTAGGDLYTFAHRTLTAQTDATLNDNDKIFTVPAGRLWWLHAIFVTFTASAGVGTRLVRASMTTNGTLTIYRADAGVGLTAGTIGRYAFGPGLPHESAFIDTTVLAPLPTRMLLQPAATVRVQDSANVDPGVDDMTVTLLYDEITV